MGAGVGEQIIWEFYKKRDKFWKISDVSTGNRQVWYDKGRSVGQAHRKRVKLFEGINKERPTQKESEGAKKSDNADILRQVWYERFFMHFLHVQYLALDIKSNDLGKIRNAALRYWR